MGVPLKCCRKRGLVCRKLCTNEDPMFLHKFFGLAALCSFVYRYAYIFPTTGNLGFQDGTIIDWVTIAVHMILSASSIIFHVLAYRIYDKPMIIWEEYRLHAIVFTLRCVSVYAYNTLVSTYFPLFYASIYSRLALPALVLSHHLVVDEITRRFGPKDPNRTTVRSIGKEVFPLWKTLILRFYSFYQFAALGSHLLPQERLADAGFNTIIAIQSSAFLMTLFRKGLIHNYSHAGWYSFCLVVSLFHIFHMYHFEAGYPFKILCAFLLRTKLRVNKYVLWILFVIISVPAIEEHLYKIVVDNLSQADIHKLKPFGTPSFQSFHFGTSWDATDRGTTMLASAAVLLLTWYVMISGNNNSRPSLRHSVSNSSIGKYFGFAKQAENAKISGEKEKTMLPLPQQ